MAENQEQSQKFICADAASNECGKRCHELRNLFKRQYSHGWAVRHKSLGEIFAKLNCGTIVEIGVARGELSHYLMKYLSQNVSIVKEYHGVDPFMGGYDATDAMSKELAAVHKPQAWNEAILNFLSSYGCLFRMHHGTSRERVSDFDDNSIDCIFFDGDHTYEGIKNDIILYAPKIKPGGALLFDDYSASYMGVVKAVDELSDVNRLEFHKINEYNNYYVVKPTDRPLLTTYVYPDDDKVPLPPIPTF